MANQTPQFRGLWIPAEVWNCFLDGRLNTTELVMLAHIDSLVRCNGSGCWQSNSAMAKLFHVDKRHIVRIIGKLKRMSLVRVVGYKEMDNGGRFRILETVWSRVMSPPDKNVTTPHDKNVTQSNTKKEAKRRKSDFADSAHRRFPSFEQNGTIKPSTPVEYPPHLLEWSSRLKELLRKQPTKPPITNYTIQEGAKHFQRLITQLKSSTKAEALNRIEDVLEWYAKHLHRAGELGLPTRIKGAKHFCNCFSWIEEKMLDTLQDQEKQAWQKAGVRICEVQVRFRCARDGRQRTERLRIKQRKNGKFWYPRISVEDGDLDPYTGADLVEEGFFPKEILSKTYHACE